MYYEQIGEYTRAHIHSHIQEYLTEQQALFSDKIPLVRPKIIEVSSVVGGTIQVARDTLPQYAIQLVNKQTGTLQEDYYAFGYPGQVVAMVGSTGAPDADKLAYRHAAALEKMAKEHPHLHEYTDGAEFTLHHWQWLGTTFSGAMQLEKEDSPTGELWVNAAQLNFLWVTSEAGFSE